MHFILVCQHGLSCNGLPLFTVATVSRGVDVIVRALATQGIHAPNL
ncbi:hypothetical protein PSAC2689_180003 [Paraburkholderia sacchari]